MIQRGEHLRLALEALHTEGIFGERGRQDFDGDLTRELGVSGAIDGSHSALAKLGDDLIVRDFGRGRHRDAIVPLRGGLGSPRGHDIHHGDTETPRIFIHRGDAETRRKKKVKTGDHGGGRGRRGVASAPWRARMAVAHGVGRR